MALPAWLMEWKDAELVEVLVKRPGQIMETMTISEAAWYVDTLMVEDKKATLYAMIPEYSLAEARRAALKNMKIRQRYEMFPLEKSMNL